MANAQKLISAEMCEIRTFQLEIHKTDDFHSNSILRTGD